MINKNGLRVTQPLKNQKGYLQQPRVPADLVTSCFPGLQQPGQRQPLQLRITVDGAEPAANTPAPGRQRMLLDLLHDVLLH
jgi:hypothetical protein